MTPLFFHDEVFLDCSKDLDTSECTFTFKGKEIYLKHTIEIKTKQRVHRMTCKVDGQTFNFGAGRSSLGGGTFGTWPRINFGGKLYRFKIIWSMTDGEKGVRLEMEDNPQILAAHRETLAEKMKEERSHSSIMEYMTSHRLSKGQKPIDNPDIESEKSKGYIIFRPSLSIRWSDEAIKQNQTKDDSEPKNQEELDDVEGFLHIHTLPPERRKQVIEQLKKGKNK
jgi:hypothetical protein